MSKRRNEYKETGWGGWGRENGAASANIYCCNKGFQLFSLFSFSSNLIIPGSFPKPRVHALQFKFLLTWPLPVKVISLMCLIEESPALYPTLSARVWGEFPLLYPAPQPWLLFHYFWVICLLTHALVIPASLPLLMLIPPRFPSLYHIWSSEVHLSCGSYFRPHYPPPV